jgi:peroxiredoxin
MKQFWIYITIASLLISCKPGDVDSIIVGQIDGYYNKPVNLYLAEFVYLNQPYGQPFALTHTDEVGKFKVRIKSNTNTFFYLIDDKGHSLSTFPLYIKPKDSISFHTSIHNTSRPEFGGDNAPFHQAILNLQQGLSKSFRYNRINEWSINDFKLFCDSIENTFKNDIVSLKDINNFDSTEFNFLNSELKLYTALIRYEYLQNHLNETLGEPRYLIEDESFYRFKQNLLKSTSDFWYLPTYTMVIDAMIIDLYQQYVAENNSSIENELDIKLWLVNKAFQGNAKEVALARIARKIPDYLTYPNIFEQIDSTIHVSAKYLKKIALQSYFNKQIANISAIKPGMNAPTINLQNQHGENISTIDFKGKIILLTFWGTWCPPCLTSIPKYVKIQEVFSEKDVVFVFVSLEARIDDFDNWKNFIAGKGHIASRLLHEKPFPGIHLFAHGQFNNPEIKPFAITAAPSYVLIDKQGKIVAPRVNLDDELIERISILLNE